jgi:hypothetical protein
MMFATTVQPRYLPLPEMTAHCKADSFLACNRQERPYNDDSTASRTLCDVKHRLTRLVLRWGTTLESLVLFFLFCKELLRLP